MDQIRLDSKLSLILTFGQRMKAAREMCGYSQIQAAKLLGYKNSPKLSDY